MPERKKPKKESVAGPSQTEAKSSIRKMEQRLHSEEQPDPEETAFTIKTAEEAEHEQELRLAKKGENLSGAALRKFLQDQLLDDTDDVMNEVQRLADRYTL